MNNFVELSEEKAMEIDGGGNLLDIVCIGGLFIAPEFAPIVGMVAAATKVAEMIAEHAPPVRSKPFPLMK